MRQHRFFGGLAGALLAVCAAPLAMAASPRPIVDLVTPSPRFGTGSSPHSPLLHGDRLFFFGNSIVSAIVGTDGTPGGTSLVTPVCETSSRDLRLEFPTMLGSAGNALRTYRNPSGRFASAGDTEAF